MAGSANEEEEMEEVQITGTSQGQLHALIVVKREKTSLEIRQVETQVARLTKSRHLMKKKYRSLS